MQQLSSVRGSEGAMGVASQPASGTASDDKQLRLVCKVATGIASHVLDCTNNPDCANPKMLWAASISFRCQGDGGAASAAPVRVPFMVLRGLTRLPERRTLRPRDPNAASLLACSRFKHQQLLQPGCLKQLCMLREQTKLAGTESGWLSCTACWPQVRLASWQVLMGVECKADEHLSQWKISSSEAAWTGVSGSTQSWQVGQPECQAQSEQEPSAGF